MITYEQILDSLKDCSFEELTEENFCWQVVDYIPEEYNVDWSSGASKGVLMYPDCDFVIKIPFDGFYEDRYETDEDGNEEYCDEVFSEFQFADDEEEGSDYCRAELLKYEHAIEYENYNEEDINISQLFAKTSFVGFVHGHPIYSQPKCTSFNYSKVYSDETLETTSKLCKDNNFYCFNPKWMSDVIAAYGQKVLLDLCHFIEIEEIRDLHSGNIGYRNGKPILFDYSSFNEGC